VLELNRRAFPPYMTLPSFYVIATRVNTSANVRVLPSRDPAGLSYLKELAHHPLLIAYNAGFTGEGGAWDPGSAEASVRVEHAAMQQAAALAAAQKAKGKGKKMVKHSAGSTGRAANIRKGATMPARLAGVPPVRIGPAVIMEPADRITLLGLPNLGNTCYTASALMVCFRRCAGLLNIQQYYLRSSSYLISLFTYSSISRLFVLSCYCVSCRCF
jgi:hypothetical protein